MVSKTAFVTCTQFPKLTEDDLLAAKALGELGVLVEAAIWDDPSVDWSAYSDVVIRSCWDYHLKPKEFLSWLTILERAGTIVHNPVDVIRRNMEKTYLKELQEDGISIVPSLWLASVDKVQIADLLLSQGWQKAVIKPVISASAYQTSIISFQEEAEAQAMLPNLLNSGAVIIQEFAEEIRTKGEWSLIFFNKEYSHSVIKRPQQDDFRVQWEHGGTSAAAVPAPSFVTQAQTIIEKIDAPLLYARVDGVEREGKLLLMELELIEPFLFFGYNQKAPLSFASALIEFLAIKE